MAKLSYYEKLKDPRWQRKRLEALNNAEFTCQVCYDSKSPLHVHHKVYFKGREPWEYEVDQLLVLCEFCHEQEHDRKDLLKYVISYLDSDGPRDRDHVAFMIGGYIGLDYEQMLANSDWDDCAGPRAYYDLGQRIHDLPFDVRIFIAMFKDDEDA